jgi:agmatine deiminase
MTQPETHMARRSGATMVVPQGPRSIRWPAEWEPHDATWLAWPHHEPDWPGKLGPIPWVYAEIVRVLHRNERVEIICHDETVREAAQRHLAAHGVTSSCRFHIVPNDRVWTRDSAPTGVLRADGRLEWVNWLFNGWAKYDNHANDEKVGVAIAAASDVPRIEPMRPDGRGRIVLEGGAIETNGRGTIMVTEECLLSPIQERNPGMDRAAYEQAFLKYLGCSQTIWLGEGCVGDDTHGHIDDIARFVDASVIVLAIEEDPADDENHRRSMDNLRRLQLAGGESGELHIVTVPFPRPVFMDGERLPASYANFYIANGVVIVPTFNDPNDRFALNVLAECFPDRQVVGIHSVDLVWGLGTLHCLSQQQPSPQAR